MELEAVFKLRRIAFWLFVSAFIFGGLLAATGWDLGGLAVLPVVFGFIGIALLFRVAFTRCPYCGKQFFTTWYFTNMFSRKCLHCKKGVSNEAS